MPEKTSNKVKKAADKVLRTVTNEEYDDESERFRDKDDKNTRAAPTTTTKVKFEDYPPYPHSGHFRPTLTG